MENLIISSQMMSSLQIAEITGKAHSHVMRDIRSLLEQGVNESNFGLVEYSDKKGEKRPCYNLTKKGCLILASGYDAVLREKIIDRWEELELSKRENIINSENNDSEITLDTKMRAATWAADFLKLNDAGKLMMAQPILEEAGLPVPEYVSSKGVVKSATELLKQFGTQVSIHVFNQAMITKGYLADKVRRSSKGKGEKHFKALTDEGLQWGENCVSRENPNEVQPRYYEDRFAALLADLRINVAFM